MRTFSTLLLLATLFLSAQVYAQDDTSSSFDPGPSFDSSPAPSSDGGSSYGTSSTFSTSSSESVPSSSNIFEISTSTPSLAEATSSDNGSTKAFVTGGQEDGGGFSTASVERPIGSAPRAIRSLTP